MLKFEDYETEQYYYKRLNELNIRHMNWGSGDVCLSREKIDQSLESVEAAIKKMALNTQCK
ncbi:MAG: hypothetical protein EOM18_05685 [Clostridia bacterium]|nr:hypothetical protein [Clostridia bacterium]